MATVTVHIVGDARNLQRALGHAETGLGKLGGFAKRAGLAIGAAFAVHKVIDFGQSVFAAFEESRKVTAQTEAVIKSMGGAANVTAKQVADLSTALSLKTGVDDELIQSGQNVLLTFGALRNEVGKGNDIFDRATKATLDMSVALDTDMKSAAIQVGKALNDPIRGISALRRAGVQFTAQQEEQIKAMVEAGDVAGAQKVILAELERQFGGSAAAQATATDRLKVAWGNIQEQLGERLAPLLDRIATFLADNLPAAMDATGRAAGRVSDFIREHWPEIEATAKAVFEAVSAVLADAQQNIDNFVAFVQTVWRNFGDEILMVAEGVWTTISGVVEGALKVIQGLIRTVTALMRGDWSQAWDGMKRIVEGVVQAIVAVLSGFFQTVRGVMQAGWQVVASVVWSAWNGIRSFIGEFIESIAGMVASLPGRIMAGIAALPGLMFQAGMNIVWGIVQGIAHIGAEITRKILSFVPTPGNILDAIGLTSPGGLGGGYEFGGLTEKERKKLFGFDAGGVVPGPRGAPQLALVHGGETILPTHKNGGTSVAAGRGGSTYNVTVNAGLGADGGKIGQKIVEQIRAYERSNGTGWRN